MVAGMAGEAIQQPKKRRNAKLQKAADDKNLFAVDKIVPDVSHTGDAQSDFLQSASRKVKYENRTKF